MKNKKDLVTGILAFLVGIMVLFHGFNLYSAGFGIGDKLPPGFHVNEDIDFVPIILMLVGIFLILIGIVTLFRINDLGLKPRSRTASMDTCDFFTNNNND